jgi:hypothetical protein
MPRKFAFWKRPCLFSMANLGFAGTNTLAWGWDSSSLFYLPKPVTQFQHWRVTGDAGWRQICPNFIQEHFH